MNAYNYILFRIYRFFIDQRKESNNQALFSVVVVSTVIVSYVFLFLLGIANYFDLLPMFSNKYYVALFTIIIGAINYYFFIKNKNFLNFNFKKDVNGGIIIVSLVLLFSVVFIIFANINRHKIFEDRRNNISNEVEEESLEGNIYKWLEKYN